MVRTRTPEVQFTSLELAKKPFQKKALAVMEELARRIDAAGEEDKQVIRAWPHSLKAASSQGMHYTFTFKPVSNTHFHLQVCEQ